MATWIGHVRIAENLLDSLSPVDAGFFCYGSLAPDCGRVSEDGKFIPPKEISHFLEKHDERAVFKDAEFYREHLVDLDPAQDVQAYSYLMGYFVHLIADGLWHDWITLACRRDYDDLIERKGREAWWQMKDDWYGLDIQFVIDHQDSLFWNQVVPFRKYETFLSFQDSKAVADQMEYIKGFYTCPPLELIERDHFPWLSESAMDEFVERASAVTLRIIEAHEIELSNGSIQTSLELLPKHELQPFDPPLGEDGAA